VDDDAATFGRLRQRFLIEEICAAGFRAEGSDRPLGGVRPSKSDGHVTAREELPDDATAEDAGRPRDEDAHPVAMSLKRLKSPHTAIFLSRGKTSVPLRGPSRAAITWFWHCADLFLSSP
jgi:hypothetical protein